MKPFNLPKKNRGPRKKEGGGVVGVVLEGICSGLGDRLGGHRSS